MAERSDFDKIELHLIRVLQTLITERSVSRAAMRLRSTQPAVSAQLKRLRALTGDPLLVRSGNGSRSRFVYTGGAYAAPQNGMQGTLTALGNGTYELRHPGGAIDRFDGRADIFTWLYRICVNVAFGRMRSRGRRPPPIAVADLEQEPAAGDGAHHRPAGQLAKPP